MQPACICALNTRKKGNIIQATENKRNGILFSKKTLVTISKEILANVLCKQPKSNICVVIVSVVIIVLLSQQLRICAVLWKV